MKTRKKIQVIALDFILLSLCYFGAVLIKRGYLDLDRDYQVLFAVLIGSWIISSSLSGKFKIARPSSFMAGVGHILRYFLYFSVILFFGLYFFQLFGYSRFIILFTVGAYIVLEIFFFWIIYILRWGPNVELEGVDLEELRSEADESRKKEVNVQIDTSDRKVQDPFKDRLKEKYLEDQEKVFDFIDQTVNLDAISTSEALMLQTDTRETVNGIMGYHLEFIANLSKLNNLRRINKFLVTVNEKLTWGGYFVGKVETLEQRFRRKFSRYPKFLRGCRYVADFFWHRVCPKVPVLTKVYFICHGKGRRAISKTEVLGRIHFCGFNIVKMTEIDNLLYFVVKKARPALRFNVNSWGLMFKQKRVGKNGNFIYTYKLRTMHPYSEYLHKYMYDMHKLNDLGKIENDTRITEWGHVMRKYWIDELPMIVNFLQGDLKLVGLRPISRSFFDIYPEDLKKERVKFKPGLIPSLYYDVPRSTDEIWESERRYIERYSKAPLRTDLKYLFKVFYNIAFKGARSG
jgi:lipopolysaccharide/colanic/teichoic acid biosynthesis glycosyltransferase